jgi:hypothetical protein
VADYVSRNGGGSNSRRETERRLVAYIMAASMPPIGFGMGVVIAARFTKPRSKHGAWIVAISIVASVIWIVIITSGAFNTPNPDF